MRKTDSTDFLCCSNATTCRCSVLCARPKLFYFLHTFKSFTKKFFPAQFQKYFQHNSDYIGGDEDFFKAMLKIDASKNI